MAATSLFGFLGITLNPLTLAKEFAGALLHAVLVLFGEAAAELTRALLGFVATTSDPVLSGGWWAGSGQALFDRVLAVSGSLLALAFMVSVVTAVLSGDHRMLARAAKRLPLAVIEMALLVGVTAALIAASDELSSAIAAGASAKLSGALAASLAAAIPDTGIVGLIGGLLVVLGGIVVWLELLCRTALIYVAVMAGPLIFAASVHPSVNGLKRRYVEGGLALIGSKVVVALALATGAAMLSGLGHASSFSGAVGLLLEALAVLAVACFSPFILLKLLVGAEAILAAEGLERRPFRAAVQTATLATGTSGFSSMLRGLGGGASRAAMAGGPGGGLGGPGGPGTPPGSGSPPGGSGGGPSSGGPAGSGSGGHRPSPRPGASSPSAAPPGRQQAGAGPGGGGGGAALSPERAPASTPTGSGGTTTRPSGRTPTASTTAPLARRPSRRQP